MRMTLDFLCMALEKKKRITGHGNTTARQLDKAGILLGGQMPMCLPLDIVL